MTTEAEAPSEARVDMLPEPQLGFGCRQRMEFPIDGLRLFGPPDIAQNPGEIRYGVIGTADGCRRFRDWSKTFAKFVPSQDPSRAHYAAWPGFESAFRAVWPSSAIAELHVDPLRINEAIYVKNRHESTYKLVSIFEDAIRAFVRTEDSTPAIWFVVVPEEVFAYARAQSSPPTSELHEGSIRLTKADAHDRVILGSLFANDAQEAADAAEVYRYDRDFRAQLKARLLSLMIPIQVIRETAIAPGDFLTQDGRPRRAVQDPATICWNLGTSIFFKAGGKPWQLASIRPGVCYVGLVNKRDDRNVDPRWAVCGAQMFLDSGDGVVFKGAAGPWYSDQIREFHLPRERAASLLASVLEIYRASHGGAPQELFIHSKSGFDEQEWAGFRQAAPPETNLVGVRIRRGDLRLYRRGNKYPVARGTTHTSGGRRGYLWTSGYVPRLGTYPGWEVPIPLEVEINRGSADIMAVLGDVLALTKLNYNACNWAEAVPVTLRFADRVGEILLSTPKEDTPPLPFKFYV